MVNAGCFGKRSKPKATKSAVKKKPTALERDTSAVAQAATKAATKAASSQRHANTSDPPPPPEYNSPPEYDISLAPMPSDFRITPGPVPPPIYTTRTFVSLTTENRSFPRTSQRSNKITLQDNLSNYENIELTESRLLSDVFKATLKGTSRKVTIEIVKNYVYQAAILNQIEIYTHLQKGLKVTKDDGLTHLIAHGIGTSSFIEYQNLIPITVKVTGPFIVTDYYGYSVYNRWVSSKDKIINGLYMFSFRTVCLLNRKLLQILELLHKRGVAHGNLTLKSILLEEKTPDQVSNVVLTDFSFARIFKDEKNVHVPYKRKKTIVFTQEETEYRDPYVIHGWPLTRRADIYVLIRLTRKSLGCTVPIMSWIDLVLKDNDIDQSSRIEQIMGLNSSSIPGPDKDLKNKLLQDLLWEYINISAIDEPRYALLQNIYTKHLLKSTELQNINRFDWYPGYISGR